MYLFRGLHAQFLETTLRDGFDERYSDLPNLNLASGQKQHYNFFGAGVYFTDDSCKSDQYVTPLPTGEFFVLLSRVAMGHPFGPTNEQRQGQRAPPKRRDDTYYDSLYGCISPIRTMMEFVVSDRHRDNALEETVQDSAVARGHKRIAARRRRNMYSVYASHARRPSS